MTLARRIANAAVSILAAFMAGIMLSDQRYLAASTMGAFAVYLAALAATKGGKP